MWLGEGMMALAEPLGVEMAAHSARQLDAIGGYACDPLAASPRALVGDRFGEHGAE